MFNTYQEAQDWIAEQVKNQGQRFFTTQEYKTAYPLIQRLYKQAKSQMKSAEIVQTENGYAVKVGNNKYLANGLHQFGTKATFETKEQATEYAAKAGYAAK